MKARKPNGSFQVVGGVFLFLMALVTGVLNQTLPTGDMKAADLLQAQQQQPQRPELSVAIREKLERGQRLNRVEREEIRNLEHKVYLWERASSDEVSFFCVWWLVNSAVSAAPARLSFIC